MDLGPFKHIVDDGLELRKGAFECVDTLLDSCLDQIDPSFFITPFLLSGLSGLFLDSYTSTGQSIRFVICIFLHVYLLLLVTDIFGLGHSIR